MANIYDKIDEKTWKKSNRVKVNVSSVETLDINATSLNWLISNLWKAFFYHQIWSAAVFFLPLCCFYSHIPLIFIFLSSFIILGIGKNVCDGKKAVQKIDQKIHYE